MQETPIKYTRFRAANFLTVGIVLFLVGIILFFLDFSQKVEIEMSFFTALSFALLGMAWIFLTSAKMRVVALILSALVLLLMIMEWGFGLHEWFGLGQERISDLERYDSFIGVMAISVALLLFCITDRHEWILWIIGLICAVLFGASLLVIFGNLVEISYDFWPEGAALTLVDALCFLLLSASLLINVALAYGYFFSKHFPYWSSTLVGVLAFSAALSSWLIFREREAYASEREGIETLKLAQESIMSEAHAYFTALNLTKGEEPSKLFDAFPWLEAVAIVDGEGDLLSSLTKTGATLEKVRLPGELSANPLETTARFLPSKPYNQSIFLSFSPISLADGKKGFFVTVNKSQTFFSMAISDNIESKYAIDLAFEDAIFFQSQNFDEAYSNVDPLTGRFSFYGSELTITLLPDFNTLRAFESPAAFFDFILGILLAIALALMVFYLQKAYHQVRKADQANREKTFFLGNVSHELRTPLHGIIGSHSLLEQTEMTKDQEKWLAAIGQSSKFLLQIVNELLDLSKIETGEMMLKKSAVNLEKLLRSVLAKFTAPIHEKGLKVEVGYGVNLPKVFMLDEGRLEDLLSNIVHNAVKYTKRGVVRLTAEGIKVKRGNYFLSIKVEDTGVGIAESQLESIFYKYQQVDIRSEVGSSGMGLAIAKRLAQMMEGDIKVASSLNKGSTFTLEIPVKTPV